MKLGFYYHIPACRKSDGRIYMPGFLGVFVDSLANEVEHLYCFLHQPVQPELNEEDYPLRHSNVTLVELGVKTPAWHRVLFPGKYKTAVQTVGAICDKILVRGPSPLAPWFYFFGK